MNWLQQEAGKSKAKRRDVFTDDDANWSAMQNLTYEKAAEIQQQYDKLFSDEACSSLKQVLLHEFLFQWVSIMLNRIYSSQHKLA